MREKEHSPSKITIASAPEGFYTKNCVVIEEGQIPDIQEIKNAAVTNEAVQIDVDEAGDGNQFAVKFPGDSKPGMYLYEDLEKKLEMLQSGEDDAE